MPPLPHVPPIPGPATWLKAPETRAVLAALTAAGFEARVVGGAVRNALLARPVADIDIATTATPEQTIAAVEAAGLKAIPTGLQHGTITVIANHIPFEVTTLRTDVETDGRHARVAFTADWAADAGRRDFTINALYCDARGTIHDPIGGLGDIDPTRVRFIGDATARIREDYLRILRFFRFTAEYTDGILDASGLAACEAERAGLSRVSAERIQAELLKLLVATHAAPVLSVMAANSILADCLGVPGPFAMATFQRVADIEAALGVKSDAMLRLAALLPQRVPEVGPDAALQVAQKLRLSNEDKKRMLQAVVPDTATDATGEDAAGFRPGSDKSARVALARHGASMFRARVLLQWAQSDAPVNAPDWTAVFRLPERWTPPAFPLTGDDLIAAGLTPGPAFGQMLGAIVRWWYDQGLEPDRAAVLAELQRRLKNPPTS